MARTQTSLDRITRKPRWTQADGRRVLSALEASGESVSAFAMRHGVQAQRIHLWIRNARGSTGGDERALAPVQFVEVATPIKMHATPARYELALPSGAALRFDGTVDAGAVRTLLTLLGRATRC